MLDAPGLVHEVYLRLTQQAELPGADRRSFLAYASRVMRSTCRICQQVEVLIPIGRDATWEAARAFLPFCGPSN